MWGVLSSSNKDNLSDTYINVFQNHNQYALTKEMKFSRWQFAFNYQAYDFYCDTCKEH